MALIGSRSCGFAWYPLMGLISTISHVLKSYCHQCVAPLHPTGLYITPRTIPKKTFNG
ncbi:hypothetical protein BS47DRAFT_1348473 [Hydnum rufescens UP504]|uniref:Uncharacterized protein n=1 Tax=Hydnum rufescens UP504 TaxID=1448309 RepID=A0A9P6ASI7_9AGAM|nr:hypothetical protein BS47DRAFT_1348473 [Hydnum rufescens UP504]